MTFIRLHLRERTGYCRSSPPGNTIAHHDLGAIQMPALCHAQRILTVVEVAVAACTELEIAHGSLTETPAPLSRPSTATRWQCSEMSALRLLGVITSAAHRPDWRRTFRTVPIFH